MQFPIPTDVPVTAGELGLPCAATTEFLDSRERLFARVFA